MCLLKYTLAVNAYVTECLKPLCSLKITYLSCRTISDAVRRDFVVENTTFQNNLDALVPSFAINEYVIYVINW